MSISVGTDTALLQTLSFKDVEVQRSANLCSPLRNVTSILHTNSDGPGSARFRSLWILSYLSEQTEHRMKTGLRGSLSCGMIMLVCECMRAVFSVAS